MPARQQNAEGPRIEPPVSLPVPPSTRPAATEAPVPLDEPPVKRVVSHGLRAGGQGRSKLGPPKANSCVASFPMTTAPASRSFFTENASASVKWPAVFASGDLALGGAGFGARRVGEDADKAVELAVELLDAGETAVDQLDRRPFALADQLRR